MLNHREQNIKQTEEESADIEALSYNIGINTLARILTSSSSKFLGWFLEALKKQWPMLNEVENSTANYIAWYGPEDMLFTTAIQNAMVRMGCSSREMLSSACSL